MDQIERETTNKEAADQDFSNHVETSATRATYIDKPHAADLSPEHREYLLQRHGTVDLDPVPGYGNADPYNWPQWKKVTNLVLVAFHAMMGTFIAASIIPAYSDIAADLGVSLTRATYLTSLQIAILGGTPLFWRPLASRYGRRPIFLLSLIASCVCNIGCAESHSYAAMGICRALVAFFICPPFAIGSGVVAETFFVKERARYMGIWTLLITLGVPTGSFIFGFVAYHVGYRWIYWVLAITNGVQFILYIFLGPETRYLRRGVHHEGSDFRQEYMNFRRIDPEPFTLYEFVEPLTMAARPCVLIPAVSYAMTFLFASVLITVELPQLFGEKFGFNAQQLGLQFLGLMIGSVIGEQLGGVLSDTWMSRRTRALGHRPQPEYRLWLSYSGFILSIVGLIVFLVQTARAKEMHWNITPVIGIAIAGVGNQLVTTVLVTYAVDCYQGRAASVGVFITFVRQTWGFIGPFWFPDMFTHVGVAKSAIVSSVLMIGVSIAPIIFLQFAGHKLRPQTESRPIDNTAANGTTNADATAPTDELPLQQQNGESAAEKGEAKV